LTQHAEPDDGVALLQMKAADQPPDAIVGIVHAAAVEKSAGMQGFEEERGDAFEFRGGGRIHLPRRTLEFGVANQLIQANGHGLTKVHGDILVASGNANQPVAVAQVLVGKTEFFRSKQQGNPAGILRFGLRGDCGSQSIADQPCGVLRTMNGVLQFAIANGRRSDNQRAIGHGKGNAIEELCLFQDFRRPNSRTGLAEGRIVRIHYTQGAKSEIAHGACRGAYVQRVPRSHQDYAKMVEWARCRHGATFYRLTECKGSTNLQAGKPASKGETTMDMRSG
jgi:hypothetical protein